MDLCIPCACAALLVGCSSARSVTGDETDELPVKPGTEAPLAVYERTLNPSDFDEDVSLVRETQLDSLKAVPAEELVADTTVAEEVASQGFRIQIYASKKIDEATAVRTMAAERFPQDSIYVVYDPPVYRVRLGDYPTRLEANQRLPSITRAGYPDAWVVTDRIILRKPPRRD